jgi:hypothetical protein
VTSKERILATIRGERADKIPVYHLQFSGHACSVILGRPDVCVGGAHNQWLEMNALWAGPDAHAEFAARTETDALAVTEACGMDLLRLDYWRWGAKPTKKLSDDTFLFGDPDGDDWFTMTYHPDVELFTKTFARPLAPVVEAPLEEDDLQKRIEQAEAQALQCRGALVDERLRARVQKYPQYLVRHGGGTVAISMSSPAELMAATLWPDLYGRFLMAHAQSLASQIPAMAAAGLDVNISGMDFCSAQGPCVSPEIYRRVVIPALKVIVDATHAAGMKYFYTSDGNFWPVADDMFNVAGVDGWMETDRSAGMDLRKLRQRFPRVTFVGNIRVQVLHTGSVDEVVRETEDCLAAAHELGGIVVGASNLIMPGTPPENIHAMLRTIERGR